ncbi:hypothetical protein Ocin01_16686 [Orchesella cincta]|uniref:Uncharacterized protein n=1 Tax=Orchesella cincta TaxID=48709 RepID=A0A1D2MAU6_ORCCI|nr:hypothetical protein Ocin01_16686 [Orchesella cincta]
MKSAIIFFVAVLYSLTFPMFVIGEPYTITDCGHDFYPYEEGVIKNNGVALPSNKRCVWTIRSRDTASYNLYYDIGSNSRDIGFTATCISSIGSSNVTVSNFRLSGIGVEKSLPDNCPVLVITLYSEANPLIVGNNGRYYLRWEARRGTALHYSYDSEHEVEVVSGSGIIKHPVVEGRTSYSNNELSTFIFLPEGNTYSNSAKSVVTYIQDVNGMEGSCCDYLTTYKFVPAEGYKSYFFWSDYDKMCASVTTAYRKSSDTLMFVFRSDGSVVRSGFRLLYFNVKCNE